MQLGPLCALLDTLQQLQQLKANISDKDHHSGVQVHTSTVEKETQKML